MSDTSVVIEDVVHLVLDLIECDLPLTIDEVSLEVGVLLSQIISAPEKLLPRLLAAKYSLRSRFVFM